MAGEPVFCKRRDTADAITMLAQARSLTIVVGAGVSMEAGLPSWADLVNGLVRRVAAQLGLTGEAVDHFVNWTTFADGLTGAGAVAKASLGAGFDDAVAEELYGQTEGHPNPGPTALAIARLRRTFGTACEIATTNYDLLLERALRAPPDGSHRVKTYRSRQRPPSGYVAVRHLHGVLTPGSKRGDIVLSEEDYHLMQGSGRWHEEYCRSRLKASTCLFLGTSLNDPNLLRYLYRSAGESNHFALFSRQSEEWGCLPDLVPVRQAREESALERWKRMGVAPLQADFFIQGSQFVHEVGRARQLGADYVPYPDRLAEWDNEIQASLMVQSSTEAFAKIQDRLHELLAAWLGSVKRVLDDLTEIARATTRRIRPCGTQRTPTTAGCETTAR